MKKTLILAVLFCSLTRSQQPEATIPVAAIETETHQEQASSPEIPETISATEPKESPALSVSAPMHSGVQISDSAQRVVDSWIHAVESTSKENTKISHEILNLIGQAFSNVMTAFIQKIEPGDAQKLLPLIDGAGQLMQNLLSFAEKSQTEKMSPEEIAAAQKSLQMQAFMLLPQAAEYIQAFSKYQKEAMAKIAAEAKTKTEEFKMLEENLTNRIHALHEAFAAKAQEKK